MLLAGSLIVPFSRTFRIAVELSPLAVPSNRYNIYLSCFTCEQNQAPSRVMDILNESERISARGERFAIYVLHFLFRWFDR